MNIYVCVYVDILYCLSLVEEILRVCVPWASKQVLELHRNNRARPRGGNDHKLSGRGNYNSFTEETVTYHFLVTIQKLSKLVL